MEYSKMCASLRSLLELFKCLGGTIRGEHGIGLVQKRFKGIIFNDTQKRLIKDIKRNFDPNYLLNKDKILIYEKAKEYFFSRNGAGYWLFSAGAARERS
jgi:FAD/FMN-containing dehydrogenase